eukprot:gene26844-4447_t
MTSPVMVDAFEAQFPDCDIKGGLFPGGTCVDADSSRGFVFYDDFQRCSGSWILVPAPKKTFIGILGFLVLYCVDTAVTYKKLNVAQPLTSRK